MWKVNVKGQSQSTKYNVAYPLNFTKTMLCSQRWPLILSFVTTLGAVSQIVVLANNAVRDTGDALIQGDEAETTLHLRSLCQKPIY
ncbi:unnamed protein product [Jaminaea pallidilutea]